MTLAGPCTNVYTSIYKHTHTYNYKNLLKIIVLVVVPQKIIDTEGMHRKIFVEIIVFRSPVFIGPNVWIASMIQLKDLSIPSKLDGALQTQRAQIIELILH